MENKRLGLNVCKFRNQLLSCRLYNPGNYYPMNFLRKLILVTLFPKPNLSRKEIIDFVLLLAVCFMIVLYKVLKS